MKVLAIDISGKVFKYDYALYECINKITPDTELFHFVCPYFSIGKEPSIFKLVSLIPNRYRNSAHLFKRFLKFIEGLINYAILLNNIKKYDLLHLQWLPFLEVCNVENMILKLAKKRNPKLKIVLTLHNIYPHNSSHKKKLTYQARMHDMIPLIDLLIVHNQSSKLSAYREFGIHPDNVVVIHHGIFVPPYLPQIKREDDKVHILQFGQQSTYKGTDILVEAIHLLPSEILSQIKVHILGSTEKSLYNQYAPQIHDLPISWKNKYISDMELYQEIQNADILTYPYRAISQSGALLLGLYFKKPVIISDLPAFRETLGLEYPEELVCKVGNAQSLANSISWCIENKEKLQNLPSLIQTIIDNNSWESAATKTIAIYHQLATSS